MQKIYNSSWKCQDHSLPILAKLAQRGLNSSFTTTEKAILTILHAKKTYLYDFCDKLDNNDLDFISSFSFSFNLGAVVMAVENELK